MRIKAEASSSMQLLRSMLPSTVIKKLKAGQTYIAQHHDQVGKTKLSQYLVLRIFLRTAVLSVHTQSWVRIMARWGASAGEGQCLRPSLFAFLV